MIEDNGIGFDYEATQQRVSGDHFGLLTMKERVELLGGQLLVESAHNSGTRITAWVPVMAGEQL
jgi:two-component system sensor histidine kinase DegS